MDYKEAWKTVKITLQTCLQVREFPVRAPGPIDIKDGGADEMARAVIEIMEDCEKLIEEEGK